MTNYKYVKICNIYICKYTQSSLGPGKGTQRKSFYLFSILNCLRIDLKINHL